jgi:nucleoside 2-deoxyribosyltransferase
MYTVYTALPITGRSYDEVVNDIHTTKNQLESYGYHVLQPMTGKAYLRNEVEFKAEGFQNPVSTNHAIFERDMFMVKTCDIVLVNFTLAKPTAIGMTMELAWASILGKHSVIVLPKDSPHRHAFILEAADIIFETTEEAMEYLRKFAYGDE